jgi:hypothetical protein
MHKLCPMSSSGPRGYPLVVTTGALPTGYLPTGVLPTGNLPTGPVCTTGCGRGRSAAMAVPIKAKDAVPMHEFQHRSLLLPNLPQVDPNDRYEAISRAQTSDRTVSFLTYVAETARSFEPTASTSGISRTRRADAMSALRVERRRQRPTRNRTRTS